MTNNDYVLRQIVLGAGVSSGYPLGSNLLRIINDICQIESPIKIENSDEFLSMVKVFAENLKKSCATSIDFYTTRIADKKMQIVAKSLIGAVLKQYKTDLKNTWYGDLLPLFFPEDVVFKKPEEKLKRISELAKEVRIVTFNYDLSLEKFLYEFLKNNVFFCGEEEQLESAKREIFKSINHVYGSIDDPFNCNFDLIEGKHTYEILTDSLGVRGGFSANIKLMKNETRKAKHCLGIFIDACINQEKYSKNINLIENDRQNGECKLIKCAYLYVLGFGFDPINIERIGMKPEVWGSSAYSSENGYGCYVTNFGDNKKIERLLINNLTKRGNGFYAVPIISKSKISDALKNDFSLMEIAKNYESISMNNSSETSPLFALKKYQ